MSDAQPTVRSGSATDSSAAPPEVVVCLPAYNEEANLPPLLERMEAALGAAGCRRRYVICDDGSRDRTAAILAEWARRIPLEIVTHAQNRGLGETIRDALRRGAELAGPGAVLLTMDADNTQPPELCEAMLRRIAAGADVVIASRYQPGARVVGLSRGRELASRVAGLLFKIVLPMRGVRDYTSGFRMYRADVIRRAFEWYGDGFVSRRGFECMADILIKVHHLGAAFAEVPMVLHYEAKQGASKMRVSRTVLQTLKLMALRRLGVGLRRAPPRQ